MKTSVRINNLCVDVGDRSVLHGCQLAIEPGQLVALTGPNGAGKTTLARTIAGDPTCVVSQGGLIFDGRDLKSMPMHERVRHGVFVSWQQPPAVEGLALMRLIFESQRATHGVQKPVSEIHEYAHQCARECGLEQGFVDRQLNACSGGQRKLSELVQMLLLKPRLIVLDEIDSGLDAQARHALVRAIKRYRAEHPGTCMVVMSHAPDFLALLEPTFGVHINDGQLIRGVS